jgi:hypothetical protein
VDAAQEQIAKPVLSRCIDGFRGPELLHLSARYGLFPRLERARVTIGSVFDK